MKTTRNVWILIIAAAGLAAAQGQSGSGARAGATLNLAQAQTISGTVNAVHVGFGMQYPSISIGTTLVKVAPAWYLLDQDFEIKTGDSLNVVAAPSNLQADSYLYAVEIYNTATRIRIVLRDSLGLPLWTGRPSQALLNAGGTCLGASTMATASGTVENLNIGAGIQMPTLTLKTADANMLIFKLGPERVLLASDLEVKTGDKISVRYAVACSGDLIALSITGASGTTLVLRDDLGRPSWH